MTTGPSSRPGSDTQIERLFIDEVLSGYPGHDLLEPHNGVCVELVVQELIVRVPNWQTDRAFYTYGRWYGRIRAGGRQRWAYWTVDDDDDSDEEREDRGRFVKLFDSKAGAADHFINDLIELCHFCDRPTPEEWPENDSERAYQTKRLTDYIEKSIVYWRALTGFPDDVIAYCIEEQLDARETWEITRGEPTQAHVDAYRTLAALRS